MHECHGAAGFNLDGVMNGIARNNVIYDFDGGGLTLFQGDRAQASSNNVVVNNTIWGPQATRYGVQIADGANNNVVFNNIIYAPNVAGLEIQSVQGLVHDTNFVSSYEGGSASTNETEPPSSGLFVDLAGGDFHLADE